MAPPMSWRPRRQTRRCLNIKRGLVPCILRNKKELPVQRIWGVQKADNNESIKITLDYLTLNGTMLEEYTLYEDGEVHFYDAVITE